jgi:hypothetical protein
MAGIEMRPDSVRPGRWWVYWSERDEIVARIDRETGGKCVVTPHGPHWSPMKSIGRLFDTPASALREVEQYFERR